MHSANMMENEVEKDDMASLMALKHAWILQI